MEKKELKANADYGNCTSAFEKHLKDALALEQENIRYFNKLVDDFIKDYNNYEYTPPLSHFLNRLLVSVLSFAECSQALTNLFVPNAIAKNILSRMNLLFLFLVYMELMKA